MEMSETAGSAANRLRVAVIAGCLGKGGAEKQLVYLVRTLREISVELRVLCLTKGEYYESHLNQLGIRPQWVGRFSAPPLRMLDSIAALRSFHPHIVQSTHFFVNLYAAAVARAHRCLAIGSVRSDGDLELESNGFFGPYLLRTPAALIANSFAAQRNILQRGIKRQPVSVVPNVIDLAAFDEQCASVPIPLKNNGDITILAIGNLYRRKRMDRFLHALARVRAGRPGVRGVIVGEGPLRQELTVLAETLQLLPDGVSFAGTRHDVPALLRQADMLVLTSDHEGFPNVILEAMAAGLPVVSTAVGDVERIVEDGRTGYVVRVDAVDLLAQRMAELAESGTLRVLFGVEGRRKVEQSYAFNTLGDQVISAYGAIAEELKWGRVLDALSMHRRRSLEVPLSGGRQVVSPPSGKSHYAVRSVSLPHHGFPSGV